MKKISEEYKTTSNSQVYSRSRKFMLESHSKICCGYCPYHKNENFKGKRQGVPQSWKKHRKTQYKVKKGH